MGERALKLMMDVLSQPAVLIAAISLIGLLLQKKPANEIVKGTTKSFLGFIVISAGAGILVGSLEPFGKMFQAAFHVNGVVPNNEAIVAMALNEYGDGNSADHVFRDAVQHLNCPFYQIKIHFFDRASHIVYGMFNRRYTGGGGFEGPVFDRRRSCFARLDNEFVSGDGSAFYEKDNRQ